MKNITQKIVIPVSIALLIIFTIMAFTVANSTTDTISSIYLKNFKVTADQILGQIDTLEAILEESAKTKRETKESKLSSLVDNSISVLKYHNQLYLDGILSLEEAQEEAKKVINVLNYDEAGYYWIDNTDYINILLPPNPAVHGSDRSTVVDKNGTYLVKELVDNSVKTGEAYVSYWFPKPGESVASEKLGHAKLFKPWNWVIGTGFYIDEIANEIEQARLEQLLEFNKHIQKINIDGIYPIIISRDHIAISTPNKEDLHKEVKLIDPVSGVDIVEQAFKTQNGLFRYNYYNAEGNIVEKIGYCSYHSHLDWILIFTLEESLIKSASSGIILNLIIGGIGAVLLSILLLFFRSRSVVKNIKLVGDKINDIAEGEGDLTKEIDINSIDETGDLAKHFNLFIYKLKDIVNNIKDVGDASGSIGETLAQNTGELSSTVEQISSIMGSINNKTDILSKEVENSNNSLGNIHNRISILTDSTTRESNYVTESSAAVEEMVASINSISNISQSRRESLNELSNVAKSGERDMNLTLQAITKIEESSSAMLGMIAIITDVSDQINLLAMNAAIEAAHAGEAGKGFAVVADEIRKLAAVTAQSTNEMTETLTEVSDSIKEASKLSDNTGKTIKAITDEVIGVSEGLTEMINSFAELSRGTSDITNALNALVGTSQDVSESAIEMEKATNLVEDSLKNVTNLTEENRRGITEITTGISDISNSLIDLSQLSNNNSANIKTLNGIVGKFKTN